MLQKTDHRYLSKQKSYNSWNPCSCPVADGERDLGKLHYLRAGGAAADANPYNSRESPYLRKRFFTCPLILPKDSENIVRLKFFAPP